MIIKSVKTPVPLEELFSRLRKIKDELSQLGGEDRPGKESVSSGTHIVVQIVDPKIYSSYRVIEAAYENAVSSFANGTNRAREMSNEFLLWLACDDNFNTAIKTAGIKSNRGFVLIVIAKDQGKNDKSSEKDEKKIFDSMAKELDLEIVKDLAGFSDPKKEKEHLERMALHKLNR